MPIYLAAGGSFLVYLAMTFFIAKWLNLSGMGFYIFFGLMSALGLSGAALWIYFKTKWKGGAGGGAAGPVTQDAAIDQIVREADRRLASQNVTIANLPLVFVVGDRASAKTSTMAYSGVEPELLAGATFGEGNVIMPTQHANIWFARGTAFVEAAGAVFADPQKWLSLVRRLKPASLKSLVGKGQQAPRGVLLCFDIETFAKPGASEAVAAAARYIQARFAEISQVLGINFPVYVLFTRTDRIQFFTDYVRQFSNEEATQVFGSTLAIRDYTQGVYAEEESRRLNDAFNNLFFSLCDKRTIFLPREGDSTKTPQPYEFPRELAKLRGSITNFLVEVCRPSQLRASPFLRGFYFSGVRPIVVSDAAPVSLRADGGEEALRGAGAATQMFRMGKLQEDLQKQAQAKAQNAGRRVPQWMFLGHLFNGILLRDTSALAASGSSTKTSFLQRLLLAGAAGLLLLFSIGLLVSYFSNQGLESKAITAAKDLAPTADLQACALPSLDQMQKLDSLRQSLAQLTEYQDNGAPFRYRLGLYAGNDLLPEVRTAYYDRFRALLFGQTQKGLVTFMRSAPDTSSPSDDYGYAYDSVKSYLLTAKESNRTSDKALAGFLGTTLDQRWEKCKQQDISKEVSDLAKTQFSFYAADLAHGNPYSSTNDQSVPKAQKYLSTFGGVKAAYMALLGEADRVKPAQSYNERFPGSSYGVISSRQVRYAFTKPGYDAVMSSMKNKKQGGEAWVLGDFVSSTVPKEELEKGIRDLYAAEYIDTWRKVLNEARFTGYPGGLPEAETKLVKLTSPTSPILCLMWWASSSTNVDLGKVRDAFGAVYNVQPPTDREQCIVDKNKAYNDGLNTLQGSISQANAPGVDAMRKADIVKSAATTASGATRSLTSSSPVDSEAHLEQVVQTLLLKPIETLPLPDPGAGANADGAGMCLSFAGLKSKFPFKQDAPDLSLQELGDIFRPQSGKLWQFYDKTGKQYVTCSTTGCQPAATPPMPVNPAFVTSFSSLVRFSKALYGENGTDPNYKYVLKPRSEFYDNYIINVNGDKSTVKAGGQSKVYSWPGPGTPSFVLEIVQKGNTSGEEVQSFSSQWSVFHFFANAERNDGVNFSFVKKSGRDLQPAKIDGKIATYDFSIDTQGAPAVFSREFLASLNCVGRVTAPK